MGATIAVRPIAVLGVSEFLDYLIPQLFQIVTAGKPAFGELKMIRKVGMRAAAALTSVVARTCGIGLPASIFKELGVILLQNPAAHEATAL